jgi:hypothetical protein
VVPAVKSHFKPTLISLGWKIVHRDARAEVLVPPGSAMVGLDRD